MHLAVDPRRAGRGQHVVMLDPDPGVVVDGPGRERRPRIDRLFVVHTDARLLCWVAPADACPDPRRGSSWCPCPAEPILPPSLTELEALAREAFAIIPRELARHVEDVVVQVVEFPDEETEAEMALDSPFDLLGLYRGVALTRQSTVASRADVDMIFLYRRPILDYWCETGEDLRDVVRHVLIHEIGHHFGFSDDDMERLEEE